MSRKGDKYNYIELLELIIRLVRLYKLLLSLVRLQSTHTQQWNRLVLNYNNLKIDCGEDKQILTQYTVIEN